MENVRSAEYSHTTRVDLTAILGTASADLNISSLGSTGGLQSALGRDRRPPSCQNKALPLSANSETELPVGALVWSAKPGIPKSSLSCLIQTLQGALNAVRRHLDCNSLRFRT